MNGNECGNEVVTSNSNHIHHTQASGKPHWLLTGAGHPRILQVSTVVLSPRQVLTVPQLRLLTRADDIVQPDWTRGLAKVGNTVSLDHPSVAEHAAGHQSCTVAPVVVTHWAPGVVVEDLYGALVGPYPRAIGIVDDQSDGIGDIGGGNWGRKEWRWVEMKRRGGEKWNAFD